MWIINQKLYKYIPSLVSAETSITARKFIEAHITNFIHGFVKQTLFDLDLNSFQSIFAEDILYYLRTNPTLSIELRETECINDLRYIIASYVIKSRSSNELFKIAVKFEKRKGVPIIIIIEPTDFSINTELRIWLYEAPISNFEVRNDLEIPKHLDLVDLGKFPYYQKELYSFGIEMKNTNGES